MYLQESNYNIGAENDPKIFSQAMNYNESELWYNTMKEEMNFMACNKVLDFVTLPESVKVIGCKYVYKTKRDSLCTIERYKARDVAKNLLKRRKLIIQRLSHVSKNDSVHKIMALVVRFWLGIAPNGREDRIPE